MQAPVPAAVVDKPSSAAPAWRSHAPTLATWLGQCGVQLEPLTEAHRAELTKCRLLRADKTPAAVLAPGKGKTHHTQCREFEVR